MSVSELWDESPPKTDRSGAPADAPDPNPADNVIALAEEGTVVAVGIRVAEMMGYTPGELAGVNAFDLIHPYDRKTAATALARRLELPDSPPVPLALRILTRQGNYTLIELTSTPGTFPEPGRAGLLCEVSDVANRWGTESALREARVLQAVVATVAARFIDAPSDDIEDALADSLALLGKAAGVDRALVYLLEADGETFVMQSEWCAAGIAPNGVERVDGPQFPEWFAAIRRFETLDVADFMDLPAAWVAEREFLVDHGIRSVLQAPLTTEGRLVGFVACHSTVVGRSWDDDTRLVLRTVADVIAAAVARARAETAHERTQAWYATLVQHSSDGILVLTADGELEYASPVAEHLFGYTAADLTHRDMLEFVHPDDREVARHWMVTAATVEGRHQAVQTRVLKADGEYVPCEFEANSMLGDPTVHGIVINVRDVTDRLAAEIELREREERLRTLIENIPGAVSRYEPVAPWRTIYISDAVEDITGYTAEDFMQGHVVFEDLIYPEDRERTDVQLRDAIEHHTPFILEYQLRHRDGSTRWLVENGQTAYDDAGRPRHLDVAVFDNTDRKQLEQRLTFEAAHDPLTRMLNRQILLRALDDALRETREDGGRIAVLFLDLDRFKLINDALGHVAGDDLLVAFSRRLHGVLRATDVASRPGGDEFVVLCRGIEEVQDAVNVAERIQKALEAPFQIRGQEVFARASIGIAISDPTMDAETALRYADMAAYRAKERGRNRYELFDEALRRETVARLEIESNLHRAVEYGELELYYQPVVELRTGLLLGFEALVRWNHPERGRLMPGAFLPAAEASGLIVPIGHHLLELACQQLKRWEGSLPGGATPTLAVNLSARQLAQKDLVEQVGAVIDAAGVDPSLLCLEITESVLMEEAANNIDMLKSLKALGVEIAIDDFGTGYSSLSYLRRFPIDVLKVDQSFVAELGNDDGGTTIVMAIAGLAHALGLELLAEGVEYPHQAELLARLGCDHAQGFLFSRPLAVPDATALLKRGYATPPD